MATNATKPTILIVPGFWEGAKIYGTVVNKLRTHGYTVVTHQHRSTGTRPPGNPRFADDVQGVRDSIQALLDANPTTEIIMVCHSAGGYIGAAATEGFDAEAWRRTHSGGGVVQFVFVAAAIVPTGFELKHPLPFMEVIDDCFVCKSPIELLFNDISPDQATTFLNFFGSQPAIDWDGTVEHAGWKSVPSVFLVCDKDAVLPPDLQLQFAQMAGSTVEHCDAAHMVQCTQPDVLVRTVRSAAGEAV